MKTRAGTDVVASYHPVPVRAGFLTSFEMTVPRARHFERSEKSGGVLFSVLNSYVASALWMCYSLQGSVASSVDRYLATLQWSDENSAFIAAIPALPGCMADGSTREEALQNLNVTAELWIAKARKMGRDAPEPEKDLVFAA